MAEPSARPPPIPGTLTPVRRIATAIAGPISSFLDIQAASGILLLLSATVALVWANSRWHASYEHLWHTQLSFSAFEFTFSRPLEFWINDCLMVIFFFVVGLEIRRETYNGELSELKRAALPAFAALGGMIAPALIYWSFNRTGVGKVGWGTPMATDIAFAVGVLALLGKRVPAAIRVLLLALAIIDDLGAIIVIAVFYSADFVWMGLVIVSLGVFLVLLLQSAGVRRPLAYVGPGVIVWFGFLKAGIHPTIAGVILGLMTPAKPWYGIAGFLEVTEGAVAELKATPEEAAQSAEVISLLDRVSEARTEAIAPVVRLEKMLHSLVAYGIMPLFAFANAGVRVTDVKLAGEPSNIVFGVVLGLTIGKPLGIFLASFIAVKLRIAVLPSGVLWRGIALVGLVGGIGFTMAIFIASLAFTDLALLNVAKFSVLAASAVTGVISLVFGRMLLPRRPIAVGVAETPEEAECSTEK